MIKTMAPSGLPRNGSKTTRRPESNIATIDVGGHLFQTTKQTLTLAGPDSLLSKIAASVHRPRPGAVLDPPLAPPHRKPAFEGEVFRPPRPDCRVQILRHRNPNDRLHLQPSSLRRLQPREFDHSPAQRPRFSVGDRHHAVRLRPRGPRQQDHIFRLVFAKEGDDPDRAIGRGFDACVVYGSRGDRGHGLLGAPDCRPRKRGGEGDVEPRRSGSTVQAIGSSQEALFVSFESGRRNSNSIMIYDLATMRPKNEIGHYEIFGSTPF